MTSKTTRKSLLQPARRDDTQTVAAPTPIPIPRPNWPRFNSVTHAARVSLSRASRRCKISKAATQEKNTSYIKSHTKGQQVYSWESCSNVWKIHQNIRLGEQIGRPTWRVIRKLGPPQPDTLSPGPHALAHAHTHGAPQASLCSWLTLTRRHLRALSPMLRWW